MDCAVGLRERSKSFVVLGLKDGFLQRGPILSFTMVTTKNTATSATITLHAALTKTKSASTRI